ncbi:MAG: hypothetical protein AAFZ65_07975 [Planctomycetota bacterium]
MARNLVARNLVARNLVARALGRRPLARWALPAGLGLLIAAGACRGTDPHVRLVDRLEATVEDPARRATLEALLAQRARAEDEFARERSASIERFKAANADPSTSRDDLWAIVHELEDASDDYRAVVLDVADGMRSLLTADEWAAIVEADLGAILNANPRLAADGAPGGL